MTYAVDGKQYVAIPSGWGSALAGLAYAGGSPPKQNQPPAAQLAALRPDSIGAPMASESRYSNISS